MRAILLFVVVCAGCSFEASCGNKKVKTREFEGTIKERTAALGLNPTQIHCGEPVEAKVGAAFTCKVELDGEKTYDMIVTVTSVDAKADRVDLDPVWAGGRAVVAAKIEEGVGRELSARYGPGITLDCGEPLRFVADDNQLTCEVASGTYRGEATLIFKASSAELDDVKLDESLLGRRIIEGILEPSVREKTGPAVAVTCGDQALFHRPADGILWCDIGDGEQQAKIKVQIDEQLTITRWDVAEPGN